MFQTLIIEYLSMGWVLRGGGCRMSFGETIFTCVTCMIILARNQTKILVCLKCFINRIVDIGRIFH